MARRKPVVLGLLFASLIFVITKLMSLNLKQPENQHAGRGLMKWSNLIDCEEEKSMNLKAGELLPRNTKVPKIVHFVWCSTHFKFNNYLSLVSAAQFLNPERIIFHHVNLPTIDLFNYETWFADVRSEIHVLQLKKIAQIKVCNDTPSRKEFISEILNDYGGIYQEESTVWTKNMSSVFNAPNVLKLGHDRTGYATSGKSDVNVEFSKTNIFCPSFEHSTDHSRSCISIRKRVYPKTFWNRSDPISKVINSLMYGSHKTPVPRKYSKEVIPNIAHMLWLKGVEVDFLFYLSCLSLLYVAKVDRLYIHGDLEPRGIYWQKVIKHDKVSFVKIVLPDVMYNNVIRRRHHMSDVFRVNIMTRYGGIYSDVDVIWTQPLDRDLLKYDAVTALDWAHAYFPFPDYINLGVSLGRRGAPYWVKLKESMQVFRDDMFGYNGLLVPYKIYERNPGMLHVNNSLQVMCFKESCHPQMNIREDQLVWDKDTFAYHWTWPTPKEFKNESTLLNSDSIWAHIGKNVLLKAGLL